jgi:hypothetical protein
LTPPNIFGYKGDVLRINPYNFRIISTVPGVPALKLDERDFNNKFASRWPERPHKGTFHTANSLKIY